MSSASVKQISITMGAIALFILVTAGGYYAGFNGTWQTFKSRPLIGTDTINLQVVKVLRDIPAYGKIGADDIEETRMRLPGVYADFYGFAADCMGREVKWTLKKGGYVSRHDLLPLTGGNQ